MKTIEQAKQHLRENWEEGTECPCCNQHVKLYKRTLTSSMAYGLYLMVKSGEEWIHLEDFFKKQDVPSSIRGDVAKFKYWKLLEPRGGRRVDGSNRLGVYKVTPRGVQFIKGRWSVPRFCLMYNKKVYGWSDDTIMFSEALKNKFNYNELMNNLPIEEEPDIEPEQVGLFF